MISVQRMLWCYKLDLTSEKRIKGSQLNNKWLIKIFCYSKDFYILQIQSVHLEQLVQQCIVLLDRDFFYVVKRNMQMHII